MKTRSQNKHFMSSLLYVSLLLGSFEARAQFNKYRSQTRFNTTPGNGTPPSPGKTAAPTASDIESMSAEDAAAALKAAETIENESEGAVEGTEEDNNDS